MGGQSIKVMKSALAIVMVLFVVVSCSNWPESDSGAPTVSGPVIVNNMPATPVQSDSNLPWLIIISLVCVAVTAWLLGMRRGDQKRAIQTGVGILGYETQSEKVVWINGQCYRATIPVAASIHHNVSTPFSIESRTK